MDTINEKEKYSFQYERATFLMETDIQPNRWQRTKQDRESPLKGCIFFSLITNCLYPTERYGIGKVFFVFSCRI